MFAERLHRLGRSRGKDLRRIASRQLDAIAHEALWCGSASGCGSFTIRSDPKSNRASADGGANATSRVVRNDSCSSVSMRVLIVLPCESVQTVEFDCLIASAIWRRRPLAASLTSTPSTDVDSRSPAASSTVGYLVDQRHQHLERPLFARDRRLPAQRLLDRPEIRRFPSTRGFVVCLAGPLVLISMTILPSSTWPLTATGAGPDGHFGGEFEQLAVRRFQRAHFQSCSVRWPNRDISRWFSDLTSTSDWSVTVDRCDRGLAVADFGILQVKDFPNLLGRGIGEWRRLFGMTAAVPGSPGRRPAIARTATCAS